MISLTKADPYLEELACSLGGSIQKNEHKGMFVTKEFESTTINWEKGGLKYSIQIFPTIINDLIAGWNFCQIVYRDQGGKRYSKNKLAVQNGSKQKIIDSIEELSLHAVSWLSTWEFSDLKIISDLYDLDSTESKIDLSK